MAKVRRLVVIPEDVDTQIVELGEQVGMDADTLYAHIVTNFLEMPSSVLMKHFPDLYRRMFMKA